MGNKAGFEYLLAYKIAVAIYDYTVEFCKRCSPFHRNHPNSPDLPALPAFPPLSSVRTHDQMIQAARSGTQNVAEGFKQKSLKSYIDLAGVARGSEEELLKDYLAYARQNAVQIWEKEISKREIREIGEIWEIIRKNPVLPDSPRLQRFA